MKEVYIYVLCFGILCPGLVLAATTGQDEKVDNGSGQWQLRGRSASYLDLRQTNGEGVSHVDHDGEFYREELSLYLHRQQGERRSGVDLRGRFTNDDKVDARRERLLYLRGYYENKQVLAEAGDVAGSFTPYVFSAALKGAKVSINQRHRQGWQAAFIGGVQKASWQQLMNTKDNEQPDRWVGAIYSNYTFAPAQSIAFTLATARDDNNSGDFVAITPQGAKALNVGGSSHWRFNRYLTTKIDMAYMRGTENMRDNTAQQNGLATKIRILTKPLPRSLRSNFTYEYVDSDFKPLVGTGAADRERFENDTSYHFNRQVKFRLNLKHYRDNLNDALGATQKVNDGVFYTDYRPDFIKRGDLGLRGQVKHIYGRGADTLQQEGEINLTVRPTSAWRYGAAYIYTNIDNDATGASHQLINTIRGIVGWKKRFSNDHLIRVALHLDYRYIDEESGDQGKIGGKIDMGYDGGKFWSADLLAQTTDTNRDLADDTSYGAYQIRGTYHPGGDRSKSLELMAEERRYHSDSSSTDLSYNEDVVQLSYLFSF